MRQKCALKYIISIRVEALFLTGAEWFGFYQNALNLFEWATTALILKNMRSSFHWLCCVEQFGLAYNWRAWLLAYFLHRAVSLPFFVCSRAHFSDSISLSRWPRNRVHKIAAANESNGHNHMVVGATRNSRSARACLISFTEYVLCLLFEQKKEKKLAPVYRYWVESVDEMHACVLCTWQRMHKHAKD